MLPQFAHRASIRLGGSYARRRVKHHTTIYRFTNVATPHVFTVRRGIPGFWRLCDDPQPTRVAQMPQSSIYGFLVRAGALLARPYFSVAPRQTRCSHGECRLVCLYMRLSILFMIDVAPPRSILWRVSQSTCQTQTFPKVGGLCVQARQVWNVILSEVEENRRRRVLHVQT
jgi:hypothetical protein